MPPQAPFSSTPFQLTSITEHSNSDDETLQVSNNQINAITKEIQLLSNDLGSNLFTDELKPKLENWGYPGFLTESQSIALKQLWIETNRRSEEFRSTIYTFRDSYEEDIYALCRWLRPCKFNVDKTIRKIEEAVEYCAEARRNKYYESHTDCTCTLGVEPSIYLQQFPQFYHGISKGGLPVFFAKAGLIDLKAIGCITTATAVLHFHWNDMFHQRNVIYQKCYKKSGGSFKRYEIIYVLDLEHLSSAQLNKQLLAITKSQCKLDELCFPEAMKTMIIINAPSCFTLVWKLAKTWIHPRNAMKVQIYGTNRSQWEPKLHEIIDVDQLPIEYGGLEVNGTSDDIMRKHMIEQYKSVYTKREIIDEETHLMSFHHQESHHDITLEKGQKITLSVFTNSRSGGTLKIKDENGHLICGIPSQGIEIIHVSDDKVDGLTVSPSTKPTRYDLEKSGILLDKPGLYTLQISLNENLQGNFLLVLQRFRELSCKSKKDKEEEMILVDGARQVKAFSLGVGTLNENYDFVEFQTA